MSAGFAGLVGLAAVEGASPTRWPAAGCTPCCSAGRAASGKRSVAVRVARGLLCAAGPSAGGCGRCGPCQRVDRREHGDLHVLERPAGKTRIPIEDVRAVIDGLGLGSVEGRGRVAVVVEAADLGVEGQNALLKTLEEPHERTWLLLTSRRPERLLETLRSRVERVPVPVLDDAALHGLLAGSGAEASQAALLVGLAQGSAGRLQELAGPDGLADLGLARTLLRGEGDPVGFARSVLDGTEAGDEGIRQARRLRAERLLALALPLAASEARGGRDAAFEAVDRLLDAVRDLDLGLGAEIVLQALHRDIAASA
ncbi:MAG: hypothetical protein R3F30_11110 [Planctomycetota bacterium]